MSIKGVTILSVISVIVAFAVGYSVSFYCSNINVDYSPNHIETFESVDVQFDPEYDTITIIPDNGEKTIFKMR